MADQHAEWRSGDRPLLPHGRRMIGAWLAARDGAARSACIAVARAGGSGLVTLAGFALIVTMVGILILSLA